MKVRALVDCYQGRPPKFRRANTVFDVPDDFNVEDFLVPCDENGEALPPAPKRGRPKKEAAEPEGNTDG